MLVDTSYIVFKKKDPKYITCFIKQEKATHSFKEADILIALVKTTLMSACLNKSLGINE
jgi:hypothetical protein